MAFNLSGTLIEGARIVVQDEDGYIARGSLILYGVSEDTKGAFEALRAIAEGRINTEEEIKNAISQIRHGARDDGRIRRFVNENRDELDKISPPHPSLLKAVLGSIYRKCRGGRGY